jgi:hypothetical protein
MLSFFQDVRFALRQLRRSPGFAVVAIVTLALGIGANTAIFLLTYSIVLRSLPVPHPGQLIRIGSWASADHDLPLSYPEYGALRTHQTAVSGLFAWSDNTAALEENGQTRSANIAMATGGLFRVLEVQPFLGRALDAEAGERGQPFKAEGLLSYDYWRAHYNGDQGRQDECDCHRRDAARLYGTKPGEPFRSVAATLVPAYYAAKVLYDRPARRILADGDGAPETGTDAGLGAGFARCPKADGFERGRSSAPCAERQPLRRRTKVCRAAGTSRPLLAA